MKRWLVPVIIVLLLVGLALSASAWLPWLLGFVGANSALIQGLQALVQLVLWAGAAAAAVIGYLRGRSPAEPSQTKIKTEGAVVTGGVETGGGPFIGRDQVTVLPGSTYAPGAQLGSTPPRLSESEQLAAYLDKVKAENNVLRLGGISSDASDPQRRLAEAKNPGALSEVFISLRIDRYRGEPDERALRGAQERELLARPDREQLTALEALSDPKAARAVLLGVPGAGKTTVMRHLAFRLAEAYLTPQTLQETLPAWQAGTLLPVVISLARLADALPARSERGMGVQVARFVEQDLQANSDTPSLAERLWREARERGVLFLFDGLDEVAPDKRQVVKNAITDFLSTRGKCRAVVTCRTYSYGDEAWRLEGWPAFQLAPLSDDEQREFIRKWYDALVRNDPLARAMYERKSKKLEKALLARDARQLQQISDNPLLLTLIAIIHTHREELPRSRVRIYEECVNLLLLRWQTRRQPGAPLRSLLEAMSEAAPDQASGLEGLLMRGLYEIVFQAREGRGLRQGETTLIDVYSLQHALLPKLGQAATDVFVEYCQSANGLLLAQGSRRLPDRPADEEPVTCFAFPHPSFEEYLAARYIAMLEKPDEALAQRNAASDRWFYVGVFLAEYGSIVSQRPHDVLALVEALLDASWAKSGDRDGYWRNVWLAGTLWPIFQAEFPDRCDAALQTRVIGQLETLCKTGQLPPRERAQAGRILGTLGDPRDLEELVTIPGGSFQMGSDEEADSLWRSARPRHEVYIPTFRIGKYPVTVGQWKRFVESCRHAASPDSLRDPDNHPVTVVFWHEAQVFCRWLTDEWRKTGKIGPDDVVRLPKEAEWEKAARGGDGRAYPWGPTYGPDKANTDETGIGGTCAVGCFPGGESPYGCLDMAGNVWEWTLSKSQDYPDKDDERNDPSGSDNRVVRGGACGTARGHARCACRNHFFPDLRSGDRGFRVVVSPGSRS